MKGKDFQIIFIVAVISLVLSVILSRQFFASEEDRSQKVETAEAITTTFDSPSNVYFNENAFNPAKEIEIGSDPNSNPFGR